MKGQTLAVSRSAHLDWAKARAIEYIDAGQMNEAFTSFASDIGKHPQTADLGEYIALVGMPQLMAGQLNDPAEMRRFIGGFF